MRKGLLHIMFRVVENIRQKHLEWMQTVIATTGWSQHRLAKEVGLSASALNKFLNDPTNTRTLNSYSVEKIEAKTGILMGAENGRGAKDLQSASTEVEPADLSDTSVISAKQGRNGVDAWVLRARVLELAGYIPGDTLIVDQTVSPQHGDVVIANVGNRNGEAETVIRIFEQSFLIAATMDPAHLSPILINKDVAILGVVTSSFRSRRAA